MIPMRQAFFSEPQCFAPIHRAVDPVVESLSPKVAELGRYLPVAALETSAFASKV
jgi:hypothetical protein